MLPPPPPPPRRQEVKQEVKEEQVPSGDISRANQRGDGTEQRVKDERETKSEQTSEQGARAKKMPRAVSSGSAREDQVTNDFRYMHTLRGLNAQDPDEELPDFDEEEPKSPSRDEEPPAREVRLDEQNASNDDELTRWQ